MSRALARAQRNRLELLRILREEITATDLDDLNRRGQCGADPDGFPPGGDASGSGDVPTPTEGAVLAHYRVLPDDHERAGKGEWTEAHDPVGDAIDHVFGSLSEALGILVKAARSKAYAQNAGAAAKRRPGTGGTCGCCGRLVTGMPDDRLRSGFCEACRKAYERDETYGLGSAQPDRVAFVRTRREQLSADRA